jgi:hypothetical protein
VWPIRERERSENRCWRFFAPRNFPVPYSRIAFLDNFNCIRYTATEFRLRRCAKGALNGSQ